MPTRPHPTPAAAGSPSPSRPERRDEEGPKDSHGGEPHCKFIPLRAAFSQRQSGEAKLRMFRTTVMQYRKRIGLRPPPPLWAKKLNPDNISGDKICEK